MNGLRQCPFEGCTKRIGRELFACSSHWFALPQDVRDGINRAWRDYDRRGGKLDALTLAHRHAYAAWGIPSERWPT